MEKGELLYTIEVEDNPYREEFLNRRALLVTGMDSLGENLQKQRNTYEKSLKNTGQSIWEYEDKKAKLEETKSSVRKRENPFSEQDFL